MPGRVTSGILRSERSVTPQTQRKIATDLDTKSLARSRIKNGHGCITNYRFESLRYQ